MSDLIHPSWHLPLAVHTERHAAKRRGCPLGGTALPQGGPTAFPPTSDRAVAKCVRNGLARGWDAAEIARLYGIDPARVRAAVEGGTP